MTDLIDKQAAMIAVRDAMLAWSTMPPWRENHIAKAIEELPPAEPQIIRCKDCKHHGYDRRDLPYCDINDYGYGWKDEDFCSYAERKANG